MKSKRKTDAHAVYSMLSTYFASNTGIITPPCIISKHVKGRLSNDRLFKLGEHLVNKSKKFETFLFVKPISKKQRTHSKQNLIIGAIYLNIKMDLTRKMIQIDLKLNTIKKI